MSATLKKIPVTMLLIAICLCVFVMQVFSGVHPLSPTSVELGDWGANWIGLSMHGEPWRLLSSLFLHIGIVHLALNCFGLWLFGQVSERLYGSGFYLALFLLSGIGGNLLNNTLTWYAIIESGTAPAVSAGASGGIMGLGAALLACAVFKVPLFREDQPALLNTKALAWLLGINIAYGFIVPNIDNAGHIGGAITGAILALGFVVSQKIRSTPARLILQLVWVLVIAMGYYWIYLSLYNDIALVVGSTVVD